MNQISLSFIYYSVSGTILEKHRIKCTMLTKGPGCPWFSDLPAITSWVLGLQTCTSTSGLWGTRNRTQGSVYFRQALFLQSCPSPDSMIFFFITGILYASSCHEFGLNLFLVYLFLSYNFLTDTSRREMFKCQILIRNATQGVPLWNREASR